jgi:hypothetical protein
MFSILVECSLFHQDLARNIILHHLPGSSTDKPLIHFRKYSYFRALGNDNFLEGPN